MENARFWKGGGRDNMTCNDIRSNGTMAGDMRMKNRMWSVRVESASAQAGWADEG